MELLPNSRPWGERVMHVLAHVPASRALPASLYDSGYVAFAAEHLGPADGRALGDDARALAALLDTHAKLAVVQGLALRYRDEAQALLEADRDLAALDGTAALLTVAEGAELLRASVLLEAPHYARLPPFARLPEPAYDLAELGAALDDATALAPWLARARVVPMRPLAAHGRLFGDEIWIGVPNGPGPDAPSVSELAMQAAHEASVAEVRAAADAELRHLSPPLDERAAEAVALVLLRTRADQAGRSAEHRRWFARWSSDPRWLSAAALTAEQRSLLECCVG